LVTLVTAILHYPIHARAYEPIRGGSVTSVTFCLCAVPAARFMVGEEPVGIAAVDAKNPREEFKRIRQQLQARGLIGIRDDFAWKA